ADAGPAYPAADPRARPGAGEVTEPAEPSGADRIGRSRAVVSDGASAGAPDRRGLEPAYGAAEEPSRPGAGGEGAQAESRCAPAAGHWPAPRPRPRAPRRAEGRGRGGAGVSGGASAEACAGRG